MTFSLGEDLEFRCPNGNRTRLHRQPETGGRAWTRRNSSRTEWYWSPTGRNPGSPGRRDSAVGEYCLRGVVAGDEGDAGSAMAAGAAEVESFDAQRQVGVSLRTGPVRPHLLGIDQA